MASSRPIGNRHRPPPRRACGDTGRDEWCVSAVNLVQAIIGCVYGFVTVERLAAAAARLRPPCAPSEHSVIRGIVLQCTTRKMATMASGEAGRLLALVEDISRTGQADMTRVITDLRALLGIDASDDPVRIQDIIDREYATKLTADQLAARLGVDAHHADVEFQARFGMSIHAYLTHRRVSEGLALVRSGIKVESAALSVGYRGKRHFYRAVHDVTGTTPAAHREPAHPPREREREEKT